MEFNNQANLNERDNHSNDLTNSNPKPEKVERGNGENDRPHEEEPYQDDAADKDSINIPGPEELPDQQKVGEDIDEQTYKKDHDDSANQSGLQNHYD